MKIKSYERIGLFIALFIAIAMMFFFYSAPLRNPNNTFFAIGGDGLKEYYVTTYYLKYDTSFSHSSVMNYPYGEHVMFTGNQTSFSFPAKIVSNHIFDVSDYAVGFINIFMLLSIPLGVVFLYLLLIHFKLNYLYSALVAVGVAFLSPQIARMGGHFSLSYLFVIPLILYLVALFHRRPTIVKSTLLGIVMLWCVGVHVYMLGFYSFIVLCYWCYVVFFKPNNSTVLRNLLHFTLQFLLPLLVFILYTTLTDQVTDRSTYPFGFLVYRAYPESVLLPIDMHYGRFLRQFSHFSYIDWEGRAYVGTAAALGFLIMIGVFVKNRIQRIITPKIMTNNDPELLNVYFWISFLALLYSFGVPFVFGLQGLVDYLGPLKQMRGIARFSWLFYYVLNVFVFYKIWHLKHYLNKYAWYGVLVLSLTILYYDAISHTALWSKIVNNQFPALADRSNSLPDNEWFQYVDNKEYQAILPIPYFHVGSENIWVGPYSRIDVYTAMVAWKTGIPSAGVYMSRTSISQTINLCQLIWEPYRKPQVLNYFNPEQDFLVVALNNITLPPQQEKMLSVSELIYKCQEFSLYRLSYDSLVSLFENPYAKTYHKFEHKQLYEHGSYFSDSQEIDFYINYFPANNSEQDDTEIYYKFPGSKLLKFHPSALLLEQGLPGNSDNQNFLLSFWIHKANTDLFLRSVLIIEVQDAEGKVYDYLSSQLFRDIAVIDGDWILFEIPFHAKQAGDRIRAVLKNQLLQGNSFTLDQIMIRNADTEVYRVGNLWIMKNNRFYYASQ